MALLIGPSGVGKTILLKRLQEFKDAEANSRLEMPSSTPTVGTNLVNISITKRKEVTIRELGGSMGPIWKNYYSDVKAIMYMVDVANRQQVSAGFIQLIELLRDKNCQHTRVLLLLNKSDMIGSEDKEEFQSLFLMDDLLHHTNNVTVLDVSCLNWTGIERVRSWLNESC